MQQSPGLSGQDFAGGTGSVELGSGTGLGKPQDQTRTGGTQDFFNGSRSSDALLYAALAVQPRGGPTTL